MKLRSENALDRYLSSNDGTKTKFHTVSGSSQHDRRMFMTSMAAATVSDGIIFEEGEGDGTARFEDVEFFTSASITKTTSFSTTTPLPSDYLLDDINIPNERLLRKHKSLTILHPADYSSTPTVLPMTAAMVVSDDKEEKEEKSKMRSKDDSVLVNRATVSTTSSSSSNVSYSFWERLLKPLNYKSAVNK